MVGAETRRVVAAVQDVERACQVEAEEQGGREAVNRVATVANGDPSVAPAVAAALPLPAAGQRVDCPLCEQAFEESQVVRSQSVASLRLLLPLNLAVSAADMPLRPVHLRRLMMTAVAAARSEDVLAVDGALTETVVEALDEEALVSLLLVRFRSFVACGYGEAEALLLAVGYAEADLAFVAEAATGGTLDSFVTGASSSPVRRSSGTASCSSLAARLRSPETDIPRAEAHLEWRKKASGRAYGFASNASQSSLPTRMRSSEPSSIR
jgi:hypothetical protein